MNPMRTDFSKLDLARLPALAYVIDEVAVAQNLAILQEVQQKSGAKILAALKAFSLWSMAPLIMRHLSGTCASGLYEARLSAEYFGGENHVFSAAYSESDVHEILNIAHTVVFNSFSQWRRFQPLCESVRGLRPNLQIGLRINPQHSEGEVPLYDPCAPGSRLGIPIDEFAGQDLTGIGGLHFHTLCEQGFEPLRRTLEVVEETFGHLLPSMTWVNFGGGHHITRADYPLDDLVELIHQFSERHKVQVYLEPGEAIAIGTGVLVTEVLDVFQSDGAQAIVNASATCHMPDTLEMPYRAQIYNAGMPGEQAYTYRLGGLTCLAGDVMGEYAFKRPLRVGDRLVFEDMAHYTMVKTSTFNGTKLPAIVLWNSDTDELRVLKEFNYDDFKNRLS